jgi:alpha-L-arabinofuranosidase
MVFMGEYAAQSDKTVSVLNRNNLECALAEAAYMTGLERNADVVCMASYAPLFAHADAWQWRPDLIWANNLHVYGTPNYYVQQLFSRNRGDEVLPANLNLGIDPQATPRVYASAARDDATKDVIIKLVNAGPQPCPVTIELNGLSAATLQATATVLAGHQPTDENSFNAPENVVPRSLSFEAKSPVQQTVPAYALIVLRFGPAS